MSALPNLTPVNETSQILVLESMIRYTTAVMASLASTKSTTDGKLARSILEEDIEGRINRIIGIVGTTQDDDTASYGLGVLKKYGFKEEEVLELDRKYYDGKNNNGSHEGI